MLTLRSQPYDERIDGVWVLGKGSYTWFDPRNMVPHMHASAGLHLAVGQPEAATDVLLNMVLTISTLMSRSHMSPFDMKPYAEHDPLWEGATVRGPVDYIGRSQKHHVDEAVSDPAAAHPQHRLPDR